ncbi:MAG: hypothetical protein L0Y61_09295 [Epsilonproteobacteria bacterium]|nr:hypothetical protein [Campylobacterota bacterium]
MLKKYPPLMFAFFSMKENRKRNDEEHLKLDKDNVRNFIWKKLKPPYERPFNIKIDEEEI